MLERELKESKGLKKSKIISSMDKKSPNSTTPIPGVLRNQSINRRIRARRNADEMGDTGSNMNPRRIRVVPRQVESV
jgi:hypothetical protein